MRFVAVPVLLVFAAIGGAAAAEAPMKIGILTELSGNQATSGQQERDGFLFYLSKTGGKLGARQVETVAEDTAGDPATAIVKIRKLVDSDHIEILIGPVNSSTGAAIRGYLVDHQIPSLLESTVDEILDGKYLFRVSFPANADSFLQGYLAGKAGFLKAAIFCPNYDAGQAAADYFAKGFIAAGGTVVQTLLPRLGTLDYGPFITQLSSDADVVIAFEPGSSGVRFLKQYADYGKKLPLYGFTSTVDETLLPAEGKTAIGFVGASSYYSTIDIPENKAFVASWKAAHPQNEKPTWQSVGGYIAGQVLDQAIGKLAGKLDDKDALVKAIKDTKLTTPSGSFRYDEQNNPVEPRYIMQIREIDGVIQPVILGVIPEFNLATAPFDLPKNLVLPK